MVLWAAAQRKTTGNHALVRLMRAEQGEILAGVAGTLGNRHSSPA